eukprot:CAMPEP_0184027144 /NCGR_PEP_ID=MMETSP0954-20121128/14004_1 /TAXON_ID=627963 /ORGANISM="Aplanochytrium sp, Strain PBS07" /LENGTH=373 /DNA_ID=CAMNT_0026311609 /DNA_START=77 /DNA_END=1203 /DNA_ORIENTATION=-
MDEKEKLPPPGLEHHDVPSAQIVGTPPGMEFAADMPYQQKKLLQEGERPVIPLSMNLYERSLKVQLFIIAGTCIIALFNLTAENPDISYCDIPFFIDEQSTDYLQDPVTTLVKLVKASTYVSVGIFVWMHLLFKTMSSLSLVYREFRVGVLEKPAEETETGQARPKPPPLIETKGNYGSNRVLENEDEKQIRVFLRGETMLFAFLQFFQDIPQATLAILYVLLTNSKRGSFCLGAYKNGNIEEVQSIDTVDTVVFIQVGIVMLSVIWNVSNLTLRWIKYFAYTTQKYGRKNKLPLARGCKAILWSLAYIFLILTPTFAIVYSDIGKDVFGFEVSGSIGFLVLTAVGALCTLTLIALFVAVGAFTLLEKELPSS